MENKGKTWSRGTHLRLPFGVNMNLNFSNMMKTACSTKLQQPVIAEGGSLSILTFYLQDDNDKLDHLYEGGSLSILTVDVYRGFTDFRYFVSRLLDGKNLIYTSVERNSLCAQSYKTRNFPWGSPKHLFQDFF